jgi:probable F420-dependent oxidoreductase
VSHREVGQTASKPRPFRFGLQAYTSDTPKNFIDQVRKAELLGYSVWTAPDHAMDHLAPLPALAAIAMSTSVIRIGTMVMSNDWRNPVLLAREAATVDWLSGGRLELGVGAGWLKQDYDRLGEPYDSPRVRIDRLEESLELMIELLSGATSHHSGRFYQVSGASCHPAPVQKPHLPIVVGGGSRRILTIAGRLADSVSVFTNIGAGQRGEKTRPDWSVRATEERLGWVREGAGPRFSEIELGARVRMTAVTNNRAATAARLGSPEQLSADEVVTSPYALVGSVDSICDDLVERRERFGFSYFVWGIGDFETMAPVVSRMAGR